MGGEAVTNHDLSDSGIVTPDEATVLSAYAITSVAALYSAVSAQPEGVAKLLGLDNAGLARLQAELTLALPDETKDRYAALRDLEPKGYGARLREIT